MYEQDDKGEFRFNRQKSIIPKDALISEHLQKMTPKDRDDFIKTEKATKDMDLLIAKLRKRDTKSNIEAIQEELDRINQANNPIKKSMSMYKIQRKML